MHVRSLLRVRTAQLRRLRAYVDACGKVRASRRRATKLRARSVDLGHREGTGSRAHRAHEQGALDVQTARSSCASSWERTAPLKPLRQAQGHRVRATRRCCALHAPLCRHANISIPAGGAAGLCARIIFARVAQHEARRYARPAYRRPAPRAHRLRGLRQRCLIRNSTRRGCRRTCPVRLRSRNLR